MLFETCFVLSKRLRITEIRGMPSTTLWASRNPPVDCSLGNTIAPSRDSLIWYSSYSVGPLTVAAREEALVTRVAASKRAAAA